jgi:hypothetical protein
MTGSGLPIPFAESGSTKCLPGRDGLLSNPFIYQLIYSIHSVEGSI